MSIITRLSSTFEKSHVKSNVAFAPPVDRYRFRSRILSQILRSARLTLYYFKRILIFWYVCTRMTEIRRKKATLSQYILFIWKFHKLKIIPRDRNQFIATLLMRIHLLRSANNFDSIKQFSWKFTKKFSRRLSPPNFFQMHNRNTKIEFKSRYII